MATVREQALERSGFRCWYCGDPFFNATSCSIDHQQPRSKGGDNSPSNIVACCHFCNSQKRSRTLEEFRAWLRAQKIKRLETVAQLLSEVMGCDGNGEPRPGLVGCLPQRSFGHLIDAARAVAKALKAAADGPLTFAGEQNRAPLLRMPWEGR